MTKEELAFKVGRQGKVFKQTISVVAIEMTEDCIVENFGDLSIGDYIFISNNKLACLSQDKFLEMFKPAKTTKPKKVLPDTNKL